MCWYTNKKELSVPQIAEQDIPIIKVLAKRDDGSYFSPHRNAEYELNKEYSVDKIQINYTKGFLCDNWMISKGLHCYNVDVVDKNRCRHYGMLYTDKNVDEFLIQFTNRRVSYIDVMGGICVLCNGYIPKGTSYYINECGEIVTTKYVITEELSC